MPANRPSHLAQAVSAALLLLPALAAAETPAAPVESGEVADVYVRETAKQHTRNYTVPASSAATGMKLTQRETPQSLSVITEKQIADQSLETLQEVLKQVPGVYHSKMGNNATGDSQFAARGGAIDSITVDGKSKFLYESKAIRRATNNLDSALYEEVAVIRGASGLANGGWGEPSGTIALTRKKPHAKAETTIEADIGSWKHYRLMLDANAPLNAAKTLRGRAVFVGDHGGDYLPHTSRHNHTLYGILAYDPAPNTQISAGAEIHTDRNRGSSRFGFLTIAGDEYDGFKPFNADPRKNSSARWVYGRENSAELFASLRHEFGNGWTLKGDYSYIRNKSEMLSGIAGTYEIASDFSSVVSADFDKGRLKEHNFSLKLDGQYPLFGRNHDFAGGISYLNSKDTPSYYTEPEVPVPDLRLFDGNVAKPDIAYRRDGLEHSRNLSVFASTRFKLTGKWSLIAGGRWTDWKYRYITSRSRFVDTKRGKTIFVPYLAATYDFTPNLTAYASYTTVFRPQVRYLSASGDALDPLEGKTYEAGLKGAWFEGRLNAALSVYQNRRDNLGIYAGRLRNGESYYRATDHTKNTGGEISLSGRLTDRWLINTSYARSKTKDSQGRQIKASYPVHLFKLFTSYDLSDRLTLGGNLNWQSAITDALNRPEVSEPDAIAALTQRAYATVDLMAKYRVGKSTTVSLYAENIGNKYYKTMPDIHVYGTPRSYTLSLRHTF